MTDLTVLVVSGGMFQGLGLLKGLRRSGRIRVVVADAFEENVTRYFADAFRRVPPIETGAPFVEALLAACRDEGVRLVLPATALELGLLSENRARFAEAGVQLAVSDPALVRLVSDKAALVPALTAAGLPALPALDPESAPLPLIGKPVGGFGSRDVVVLRTPEEREHARRGGVLGGRSWQRFLAACEEVSADFAIGMDGVPGPVGLRRRVRTSGGFAVVCESVSDARVLALVPGLVDWLRRNGGRGLFNVQFLIDPSPEPTAPAIFVSDVNARFGTSAVHWNELGVDPVLFLCASVEPRLRTDAEGGGKPRTPHRLVRSLAETWLDLDPELARRERGVEAVVFDLDDTLLDHKAWIVAKLELAAASGTVVPATDLVREGLRIVEEGGAVRLVDALAERFGLAPGERDGLLQRYRAARPQHARLHRDVAPTLDSLRRRGYRLAVLTDNPPAAQRDKLEAAGLAATFDATVFSREHGAEKPARAGFDEVARRLGLPAEALAMVGDNPWRDVAGALRAGYAVAYQVQRVGALMSFDTPLFRHAEPELRATRRFDGLQGVLVFLERPPRR